MSSLSGRTLSHYRLLALVGEGGMGEVYRAEDTRLQREVAIKVLPAELAGDADRLARFEREARAVAALNHPNIVTIHSVEEADGVRFIVMELIEGQSLDRRIPEEGMALEAFFDVALPLTDALASAHERGIVHRDVKTANVMVTADGRTKILDFGLAKVGHIGEDDVTTSLTATKAGAVLGTPAYMAPEQARGETADPRSDVFATGAVMHEMLTGQRAFKAETWPSMLNAILHESPEPVRTLRHDLPADLSKIVTRCLEKDAARRYASAGELHRELVECKTRHLEPEASLGSALRRPKVFVPLLLLVLGLVAAGSWWSMKSSRDRRVRTETLPQIEALIEDDHNYDAYLLAREAMRALPDDPTVKKLYDRATIAFDVTTEPEGADVWFRSYRDLETEWVLLGRSPLEAERIPAAYLRVRVEKEGYEPVETSVATWTGDLDLELTPSGEGPPGMVRVPESDLVIGRADPIPLGGYWIDRYEVTNAQYQEFVDAGGYDDAQYWQEPIEDDGRVLGFEEAMERFVDATGRPGPATWELGRFPEGQEDHPVGGVSWYEASAYAVWAGKSLPTVFHWRHSAGVGIFSDILLVSNFDRNGPAPVGQYRGLGPFGTYDMAGNLKEWCFNRSGDRRYIQGGAWNEEAYLFGDDYAWDPLDRQPTFGFRCVLYDEPAAAAAMEPVASVRFDFRQIEPVSDEIFEVFAARYAYEPTDLELRPESTDEDSRYWRRESFSLEPAYEAERVMAHVFLPKNGTPPYQVVLYRPGSIVNWLTSIDEFKNFVPDFLPRSGRAVVIPAMWGTLERRGENRFGEDRVVRQVLDMKRTIDYLETRSDLDLGKLAYVGLSAGGEYGPVYVAMEPRFATAVFLAGGFHDQHMLGEARVSNPWNYASRVQVPTLMVNGDADFTLPLELAQKPMYEMLGTPAEHKKHVVLSGGHVPFDRNDVVRETLDWLDRYLGPVETSPR